MAKVLVVAPYVPHPARHGGAIRSRVLLDALTADHEVHLAAAATGDEDRANGRALAQETGIVVHELAARAAPGVSVLRKLGHWLRGGSELASRRWTPAAAARVAQLRGQFDFDLVVVDSTFAVPVAGAPSHVLFLHNLEHAMFARDDAAGRSWSERCTRRMEAAGLRRLERRAIATVRPLTVTVSEHDRDLALGLVPDARVEVVPNSVDLERLVRLPAADPAATPRLLFVGSLDYPPNLEAVTELVEAHLPVLRAAFPGLVVRLVGKDPGGLGARFADVPGVELVGPVDDVAPQYRDVQAVYLPIRSGGGTRIKILEAWALGVPVLATAVGCEGLPADPGRHLLGFETPDQGVAALRDVLGGRGQVLRDQGRQLVEARFSHTAAVARLRELVGEALAQVSAAARR